MIEIKAPNDYLVPWTVSIFLAGSIEQGTAKPWQKEIVEALKDEDILILNPRRDDWDSTWKEDINNPKFKEQVLWELRAQEDCDMIILYFDPDTKSPISLLELGLFKRKMMVVCPEGYWKKGNVDIVCERFRIPTFPDLKTLLNKLGTYV